MIRLTSWMSVRICAEMLFVIPESWIVSDLAGMVMDGENINLSFRNYFINDPVISENKFPEIVIIELGNILPNIGCLGRLLMASLIFSFSKIAYFIESRFI